MNRLYWILLLLPLAFAACKDEDPIEPLPSQTLTAKVDGQNWTANYSLTSEIDGTVLQITGSDNIGNELHINVLEFYGPGTYTFGGDGVSFNLNNAKWVTPLLTYATRLVVDDGSITISKNGDSLHGTFSLTPKNSNDETIEITDGKFTVNP